jgi:hydroxymethylpyrimidine pyrophosphatase-like HAD family hydrolase
MDRTLIPNGPAPEDAHARERFRRFCRLPNVTLAYVTGRHRTLVEDAIAEYDLPIPDFAITDVGSKIYHITDNQWLEFSAWEQEIGQAWRGKAAHEIAALISGIPALQLQEASKQNTHKLSYYLSLAIDKDPIIAAIDKRLNDETIAASLIWSIDEAAEIGLLDILPRHATKLHAVEFLQLHLKFGLSEVIFAGDSGNDLPLASSSIPTVFVANASLDVKQFALDIARQHHCSDALYLATGDGLNMNGNYAAGILEGVWHFAPTFRKHLQPLQ